MLLYNCNDRKGFIIYVWSMIFAFFPLKKILQSFKSDKNQQIHLFHKSLNKKWNILLLYNVWYNVSGLLINITWILFCRTDRLYFLKSYIKASMLETLIKIGKFETDMWTIVLWIILIGFLNLIMIIRRFT